MTAKPARPRRSWLRSVATNAGGAVVLAVLVISYFLGTLDDAVVRGGNAPVRRGLYWAAGALRCMTIASLLVLVAIIARRRWRKGLRGWRAQPSHRR